MDILEAHAEFAKRPDSELEEILGGPIEGPAELMPLSTTSLAELSGQLDSCTTFDELCDAVRHGMFLLREGMATDPEFTRAYERVESTVMRWGLAEETRRARQPL